VNFSKQPPRHSDLIRHNFKQRATDLVFFYYSNADARYAPARQIASPANVEDDLDGTYDGILASAALDAQALANARETRS
jgi:hypothetical protein